MNTISSSPSDVAPTAFPPPEHLNLMKEIIKSVDVIVPRVDSYHEKIVYIHPETNETSYSKPWFLRWRDWRTFWVTSERYVMLQNFDCQVEDLQTGHFIRIDIMCRVQLNRGSEYKAVILLSKEYDIDLGIKNHICNWIRQFARQHTHIVKNYFTLENELMEFVSSEAERNGIKIELFLSPFADTKINKEYVLVKQTIQCQIKDWEIGLVCTLVMNLWDERRFKMARIDNVEKWMKEKIERIIQGILIDKTITDLLQGYPSAEIQRGLEAEAYDIGFRIKQLISIPLIDALELLKGFQFESESDHEPEITYYTKDARVPVLMKISVKGKIDSFEGKIAQYLKPGISLIARMRESVIDHARYYLKRITPERFYFHFDSDYKGRGSFEKELENEIKNLLVKDFNVSRKDLVIYISPKDTELTNRFTQIAGRFGFFTCQSISEQVAYAIHFSVKGVDPEGWYVFKSRIFDEFDKENLPVRDALKNSQTRMRVRAEEELLSIGSTMRHHMELVLNTQAEPDLELTRNGTSLMLVSLLFSEAAKQLRKSHGLVIELISLERLATSDDTEYKKQLDELVRKYKSEASAKLLKDLVDGAQKPIHRGNTNSSGENE